MQLKDYVHTTATVLSGKHETNHVIDALKKYLTRRGQTKFYPTILRGVLRELNEQGARNATKVYVARETDICTFKAEIDKVLKEHKLTPNYTVITDPTIIGGYIVRGKQTKIDHSYKTALFLKYQSLKQHI